MHTTQAHHQESNHLETALLGAGVIVAALLFVVIVGRMNLFGNFRQYNLRTPPADLVVIARQMRFGQEEIQLKVGETVAIVLENEDPYAHSFDADDFDIHVDMPAKRQALATFTATRPGVFEFYCGVPGHTEAGMVGRIVVTP